MKAALWIVAGNLLVTLVLDSLIVERFGNPYPKVMQFRIQSHQALGQ